MKDINSLFWLVPVSSVMALFFAWMFYSKMKKEEAGTEMMQKIARYVREGALAYLKQQYKIVGVVFVIMTLFFAYLAYGVKIQNPWVPFAFLTGGFFSGLAGFFGMKTATYASNRAAWAASKSLDHGLRVAFRSGAVMGLVVVGLALLDISVWFLVLNYFIEDISPQHKMMIITTTMLTFGMGASLQALFARVGGGIFTKAADVGADLVGKVEAGIPEDDPRNPATIADNVGDNVGDVAGMGADLYESYCGAILATAALGAAAFMTADPVMQMKAVLAPMIIAALGTMLSILGIYVVKVKAGATSKQLLGALGRGVNVSSIFIIITSFLVLYALDLPNYVGKWLAIVSGLVVGIAIGKVTEFYTSEAYRPTQNIAEQAQTGPATVIIAGMGTGMLSTCWPVMLIIVGTMAAYMFSAGGNIADMSNGLYGIGIAAVGMLSTLGITLATDAYGPIADNAGGNAEMAGLGKEVRQRTDMLDSLGNTTAATGKGFAIGSAALTALALMASYVEEIRMGLIHSAGNNSVVDSVIASIEKLGKTINTADLVDFMAVYEVHLLNPKVLLGMFFGAMMSFLFCGLTMNAVGRAANKMVNEVRRQFREMPGIMSGTQEPDFARCVSISTKAAQSEMIFPSLLAVFAPVGVGLLFGVSGVLGLLGGSLASGFVLAVFMANSGGAWDNAKKYIEQGNLGGKGSAAHKAAVIGDTVGDPFKDTSGPSLNILIKLMSMVSIVMAGFTVTFSIF